MVNFLILPIIFFAFFVQGVTGFGSALVSMPVLSALLGIGVATPLFALLAMIMELAMLVRYRSAVHFREVWRLQVGSLIGIPIGVYALGTLPEQVILTIVGILVLGYALYALIGPALPKVRRKSWEYGFGMAAGLLSGAYNTGGPPFVIYGSMSRWDPQEFKGNIQMLFILNTFLVIAAHGAAGHFTLDVWQDFFVGLPAVVLGLFVGFSLDRFINPDRFRQLVLVLLVVLALTMIF